ncbi:MAG: hydroxyacylglutathione hydrolase [Rhodocyclales bacterium]|nr:hydroxyacylglutathione hydrolase [Rhodocyclales bacterium]
MTTDPASPASSAAFDVRPLPAFRDNYIWLLSRDGCAAVVDPGDAAPVEAALAEAGLCLVAILVTHHHADHQGGVERLVAAHGATVFGPAAESITGLSRPLRGGERIEVDGLGAAFDVLSVPGHTRGHLAYLAGRRLFCGDTLFGAGCGRLFEGTPAQMAASLGVLAGLPDDTEVYCAHEYTEMNLRFAAAVEPHNPAVRQRIADAAAIRARGEPTLPSTIGLEKATNPFLRCAEPAVIAAARQRDPSAAGAVGVFAAIRGWRNEF